MGGEKIVKVTAYLYENVTKWRKTREFSQLSGMRDTLDFFKKQNGLK